MNKLSGGRFELRTATIGFNGIRNRIKISKEKLKTVFYKIFERKKVEATLLVEDLESIIEVEGGLQCEESEKEKGKDRKKQNDYVRTFFNFMPVHIEMKEMVFHYSNQHIKRDH